MKRRALCVLVFPVECFVDKKGGYFCSFRFIFQDLLKYALYFEDIYFDMFNRVND